MAEKINVLLAEDHTIVREGLKPLLEGRGVHVVGEAADGLQAVRMARGLKPDIMIMDIGLPHLGGIEAVRRIMKSNPSAKIIVLTIHDEIPFVFKSLEAGAKAYLVKDAPLEELVNAINTVMKGDVYLSSNFPRDLIESYKRLKRRGRRVDDFSQLTRREREVLQHIANGYTSPQIAQILYISKKTVENHRQNIMKKLNIHDTAGLVRYAIKIGLVET